MPRACSFAFQHRLAREALSQCTKHRCFTTEAGATPSSAPNPKLLLHKIIKNVHPDYFSSHPQQQNANTKSLQLLYEWFNEYESGGGGMDFAGSAGDKYRRAAFRRVGRKFEMVFYLKDASAKEDAKEASFREVSEVLYGPAGSIGVKEKNRQLSIGLVKLMRQMSLQVPSEIETFLKRQQLQQTLRPTDAHQNRSPGPNSHQYYSSHPHGMHEQPDFQSPYYDEQDSDHTSSYSTVHDDSDSIIDFLHSIPRDKLNASVVAKENQLMARVDVDLFRNRIGEFLNTSGIFMRAYGTKTEKQLELIHNFLRTLEQNFQGLDTKYWNRKQVRQTTVYAANEEQSSIHSSPRHDALKRRVSGMQFFIDEGHCRIEDDGSVVLGADDSTQEWLDYLEHGFDPEEAMVKRHFKAIIHSLERTAARKLGIVLVVAESEELSITPDYSRFLEALVQYNPPDDLHQFEDFYDGVYLVVREKQYQLDELSGSHEEAASEESIRVHPRFGFFEVTLQDTPDKIHEAVAEMGLYARHISEKNQREARLINSYTNRVRRRLNLHTIEAVKNLSSEQIVECCGRLLENAMELTPMLRGKNILISDGFEFHNNFIEIQWNFKL